MAFRVNETNFRLRQILLYGSVAIFAILIPVLLKVFWGKIGIDTDYLITFLVLLAGSLYELYSPWIDKLMKYKKEIEKAGATGEQPPNAEEYFKHGITFNKWFIGFQTFNFFIALALSWYILSSGSVIYKNWVANIVMNFTYAVGQAKILKERLL